MRGANDAEIWKAEVVRGSQAFTYCWLYVVAGSAAAAIQHQQPSFFLLQWHVPYVEHRAADHALLTKALFGVPKGSTPGSSRLASATPARLAVLISAPVAVCTVALKVVLAHLHSDQSSV